MTFQSLVNVVSDFSVKTKLLLSGKKKKKVKK